MFSAAKSAGPSGYNLNNSLRFRASASAYLSRTFATTGTSRQKFTFSFWIKRGGLTTASQQRIMDCYDGSSGSSTLLNFETNDTLSFSWGNGSAAIITTTQVFRDPSAWYHIVIAVDTTQATASNRGIMYVNGSQVTSFSTATYPTQNLNCNWMYNNANNRIMAQWSGGSGYADGYLAEVNFVDGQALTPSSFGSFNATTGVWQPARYTGTYGTNGFYLNFTDIGLTSGSNTGLGRDFSGNGNFWNTTNISVTAGTTYDAMSDVPTNTSATVANYPTLNPLSNTSTLTEANLTATNIELVGTTMATPTTGKWYFEYTQTTSIPSGSLWVGVSSSLNTIPDNQLQGYAYASDGRKIAYNVATSGYGATWTNGDIIGCALDLDNQTITFYKNGTSQGTAFTSITAQPYVFALSRGGVPSTKGGSINCGQRPFSYTPPTGFVRLNTYNLPDSTIKKGNTVMDATTYTGTGSSNPVVNAGSFAPDLLWVKDRSRTANNILVDSVRGVNNLVRSESTAAEVAGSFISSLNSNGFTLAANTLSDAYYTNVSGDSFVGWQWKASGSTVSNTAGTITSTVSANTTAGFSIVTYAGTSAAATVGHGLGVAPAMIIVKSRTSGTGNWCVYHKSLTALGAVFLNLTNAYAANANIWNNTAPTSTVFSLAGSDANTGNCVAYCWAEIAGFSKAFSYTGNGSTDGVFVNLGFRPKFVLLKGSSTADDWYIHDSTRNTYNVVDLRLSPNLSSAEFQSAVTVLDFLSNGFKLRTSNGGWNGSGNTYIGIAFAENPFKNALAR